MFDTEEAVDALCETVGSDERPMWTVFDRDDGEPDGFALIPGPGAMLGWRAPPEVWAVGMVAGGTATVLANGGVGGQRCQVACVVDRWGSASGRVRFVPPMSATEDILCEAPQDGRVLDILRRCLGLDTAAPRDPVEIVLSLAWLVAVVTERRRRSGPLGWADAIALHPVVALLEAPLGPLTGDPPAGTRHPGDPLVSVIDAGLRTWDWREVRQRCVDSHISIADITPDIAGWMDDGMFSRWLAEGVEPVELIIESAFQAVNPDDHAALRRLLLAGLDCDGGEEGYSPPTGRCDRRIRLHRR